MFHDRMLWSEDVAGNWSITHRRESYESLNSHLCFFSL